MASSMISSATVASVYADRAAPAQASLVAPFTGLKSASAFPGTKKTNDITSIPSNGGRVQCMKVWPTVGLKKFETLSYLPPLSPEGLAKEVDYLLRKNWVPCLEFELEVLDHVEAAHVWMHRLFPSVERARGGQEGVTQLLHPYHRIRQRSSSAVHQFHRLQACRLLISSFMISILCCLWLISQGSRWFV